MDIVFLVPIGLIVFYSLLALAVSKYHRQSSQAVTISPQVTESTFALKEGQTIVGVMDVRRNMRFYISDDVIDLTETWS